MAASSSSNNNSIRNTTFAQADPTTFRAIVQRLTGKASSGEMGPAFKLQERRPTTRKLEIKLASATALHSPTPARCDNTFMASPVSPLEYPAAARGSPRTPMEEEERAIANKGFYLHPSPLSTPRGSEPPELLPLFPLCSPTDDCSSSSGFFSSST